MSDISNEPITFPAIRHDGWTGEAMAKFLEELSDTGIVIDACNVAGKSKQAAYALRRRNPLFAKAWELALGNARDRLADTLLARSIEGNVEQIIKDGEIVAEKHFIDNRLGLAILKRLDKRSDEAGAFRRASSSSPYAAPDFDVAINALRTGNKDDIAAALVRLHGDEVDEVDSPLFDDHAVTFRHPRIWRDFQNGEWRTSYPPAADFDGFEQGEWEDHDYQRALTNDELAGLIAAGIADPKEGQGEISIEEDEAERRAFFERLLQRHSVLDPASSFSPSASQTKADAGSSPA